ncbi:MAG: hypothetical protein DWQ31_02150 [Planctomycetota bacterium]|nr:MAG: hypothetical protein DWQ31_02150 [Planctomycetota bacterium]REJ95386.1 MAG: hypothetical protein DWQ35_06565 [Planctomycetota bacterium]REK17586.1 MAG: hypothetical protein DWQ42_22275 [Planctomycetota bacterium]REK39823.1 MAG: hypothetical protein DWQ46_17455 [Planctomycetota bacterium]
MVSIAGQREASDSQVAHITEATISKMTLLLRSRVSPGERSFRVSAAGARTVIDLDVARQGDALLEIDVQILPAMDRSSAATYLGRALPWDAEQWESCWLHGHDQCMCANALKFDRVKREQRRV